MLTRNIFKAIGVIAILSLAATAAYAKSMPAQDFVTKASIANMFEIETSKLALDRAQRDDVKSLANMMVEDHTKTGERMKDVLAAANSSAKPAGALDSKHQKMMDKLEAASDEKFDAEYLKIQNDAHKDAVNLFSDYSKSGKDAALKDFATETLPTLQQHWEHVREVKSQH
jgi:putative membrane protein